MQTHLADFIKDTPHGIEAEAILRSCVHCGFCNATCPTYRLLGDELDGPRGRIYLMKQVLEGAAPTARTQLHLDRCLMCRACETACPSGVRYHRLLDITKPIVDQRVGRSFFKTVQRRVLRRVLSQPWLFGLIVKMGQTVRPLLPAALKRQVPLPSRSGPRPASSHARRMLLLEGCVQHALSPDTNAAATRVLDRLGISLVAAREAGCCGVISMHLDAEHAALAQARRNIDAWWPYIEDGAEAIVMTVSGCATMVADYGKLLAQDPHYAAKAERVSALMRDISAVVAAEKAPLSALLRSNRDTGGGRVALQSPCSLQHGLCMQGQLEALLAELGFALTDVPDAHQCCGSAGTYSMLQPELSQQVLAKKIAALNSGNPSAILTANVGCQAYLQTATDLPVMHWIEALDARLERTTLN